MPLPPYSWRQGDYVTSARLNSELRNFMGIGPLTPNGIGFHMKRPVYVTSFAQPGTANQAGTSSTIASNSSATAQPIASGMGFYGGDVASAMEGTQVDIGDLTNASGFALGGTPGGLYYTAATVELGATTSTAAGTAYLFTGFGNGYGAFVSMPSAGMFTDIASPSHTSNAWGASVLDVYAGNPTCGIRTAAPLVTRTGSASDGSGQGTYLKGFWIATSPLTGNNTLLTGTTASTASLPVVKQWTSGSTVASTDLQSSINQVMTLLNNPPVMQTANNLPSQTWTANTQTPHVYAGNPSYDTYSSMNTTTGVYTIPVSGLYLITTFIGPDSTNSPAQGWISSGVRINGGSGANDYMGPINAAYVATTRLRGGSIRIFSLNAGDTVQHVSRCSWAGTGASGNDSGNMSIVWLGYNTAPATLPTLPNPTTTYSAGANAATTQAYFTQLSNDLTFLTQRPYGLSYTTSTASLLNNGGIGPATYACPVHGDAANGWGGMTPGTWTAPVDGWYVVTGEYSATMTTPATGNPFLYCGFRVNPSGSAGTDLWEGHRVTNLTTGNSGGASAFGVYYLRQGDTCVFYSAYQSAASGVTYTQANPIWQTHFEAVWLSN